MLPFPMFQPPFLGNGMVIGLNAVIHVVLSHGVAIGVVTMIATAAWMGWRRGHPEWDTLAGDLLKPTVIIITGVGAVTGVGIWFTTSAIAPRGIGAMLRVFFWPWFAEWLVFTSEVIGILLLYFYWSRWTAERKKYRWQAGFGYALLGSLSAFLITGILGFMLTPDAWPNRKTLVSGFFNPSFYPQLVFRLGESIAMGALFVILFMLFTRRPPRFRRAALRIYSIIFGASLAVFGVSAWWYFSVVPATYKTHAIFSILTSHYSQIPDAFLAVNAAGFAFLIAMLISGMLRSVTAARLLIIPAIVFQIGFAAEYERVREFIRGPFLMPGYMYVNQVLLKETPLLDKQGMLGHSFWFATIERTPDVERQGAYLFGRNCAMCHTIGGLNDIRDRLRGRTLDGVAVILAHTHEMVPFMPPFSGTAAERRIAAQFLFELTRHKYGLRWSTARYQPIEGSRQ